VSGTATDRGWTASTDLAGRRVVVTGAGRGVGAGIALAFGGAGARVVVAAHHIDTGEAVAAQIRARGGEARCVECDVTRRDHLDQAIGAAREAYGGVDVFVHNATSNRSSELVDLEGAGRALWEEHASVSIRALFDCAQAAAPHLVATGGSLLVLTSPAGMQGSGQLAFYGMVKGAQRGFIKSLAREWGPLGVRVNGLAPLAVTPALEQAFRNDPGLEAHLRPLIPMGRFGDPETDIGPAALFLCSDAARYVVGQTLVVSGGRYTAL